MRRLSNLFMLNLPKRDLKPATSTPFPTKQIKKRIFLLKGNMSVETKIDPAMENSEL